jgi:protein subunit release factor A
MKDSIIAMNDMDINEADLLMEFFYPQEPSSLEEHLSMLDNPPIRITHKPTGLSAIGEGQGSQVKNKQMALDVLRELLSSKGTT